jgi:hypothetical protein
VNAIDEVKARVAERTWDKEIILWVGPEIDLLGAIKGAHIEELDLLDLFNPSSLPIDDDDTRAVLTRMLRTKLQSIPRSPEKRVVLIVKSVGLLARYDIGVKALYDWFIGSFAMVILVFEPTSTGIEWPEDVECETGRIEHYFTTPGSVKQILHMES